MAEIIRIKKPFKERVKDWWEDNGPIVMSVLLFVGFVGGGLAISSVGNKNSSDSSETDNHSDDDNGYDYNRFEKETNDEIFVQYYDAGVVTPGGCRPRTMTVETDYKNLGYLGEKIVKNFDIDPDELPYVTVNFTTYDTDPDEQDDE